MRTPNLTFDITEHIAEYVRKKNAAHETKIIMHVMKKKGLLDKMDVSKFTRSDEKVKYWSCLIHTLRYDGILIFRRFNTGLNGLQYRYEID